MLADTEIEAKEKEAEPQTNSTLPEAEAAPLCRFSPMFAFQKLYRQCFCDLFLSASGIFDSQ